jgi:AGCS family alanine or glycine:cation symporter
VLPDPLRRAILWGSDFVWGPWTIALLLATGLFLTLRYRFVQVVRFPEAFRTLVPVASEGAKGALSPWPTGPRAASGPCSKG